MGVKIGREGVGQGLIDSDAIVIRITFAMRSGKSSWAFAGEGVDPVFALAIIETFREWWKDAIVVFEFAMGAMEVRNAITMVGVVNDEAESIVLAGIGITLF